MDQESAKIITKMADFWWSEKSKSPPTKKTKTATSKNQTCRKVRNLNAFKCLFIHPFFNHFLKAFMLIFHLALNTNWSFSIASLGRNDPQLCQFASVPISQPATFILVKAKTQPWHRPPMQVELPQIWLTLGGKCHGNLALIAAQIHLLGRRYISVFLQLTNYSEALHLAKTGQNPASFLVN